MPTIRMMSPTVDWASFTVIEAEPAPMRATATAPPVGTLKVNVPLVPFWGVSALTLPEQALAELTEEQVATSISTIELELQEIDPGMLPVIENPVTLASYGWVGVIVWEATVMIGTNISTAARMTSTTPTTTNPIRTSASDDRTRNHSKDVLPLGNGAGPCGMAPLG